VLLGEASHGGGREGRRRWGGGVEVKRKRPNSGALGLRYWDGASASS